MAIKYEVNQQSDVLIPVYKLTEQVGLELQYEYEAWLFKGEILYKDSSQEQPYLASVIGFEYTVSNIFECCGSDIIFREKPYLYSIYSIHLYIFLSYRPAIRSFSISSYLPLSFSFLKPALNLSKKNWPFLLFLDMTK